MECSAQVPCVAASFCAQQIPSGTAEAVATAEAGASCRLPLAAGGARVRGLRHGSPQDLPHLLLQLARQVREARVPQVLVTAQRQAAAQGGRGVHLQVRSGRRHGVGGGAVPQGRPPPLQVRQVPTVWAGRGQHALHRRTLTTAEIDQGTPASTYCATANPLAALPTHEDGIDRGINPSAVTVPRPANVQDVIVFPSELVSALLQLPHPPLSTTPHATHWKCPP
mmetsp:Transcript_9629/g.24507  ORF Transcript_9629/g.24507 Transcript_9629/m.24507 type:complete len:224 (-) Transcript_9629:56-727(-)